MFRRVSVAVAGLVLLAATNSASLSAHHAFSAEFDATKPVLFHGTIVKVEWTNPHTWIHINVKNTDGTVTEWMIEGGTPNTLLRRGFTKVSMPAGIEVVVTGFQAKDGTHKANGRDLTLPDGRSLFLGSTGTGAPSDGKEPDEK